MQTKIQHVKTHFDNTKCYVAENLVINMRVHLIRENLPDIKDMEILDIGCGNGDITLPYLKDNSITFLDVSKNMLDLVRNKIPEKLIVNAELINQDFESYIPDKNYNYIFLIGVLAHIESISGIMKKITGLIKKDGNIVLQYTNSVNIISIILKITGYLKSFLDTQYNYKINRFSDKKIRNILEYYNLTILKKISYWPALPGFKYVPMGVRVFLYNKVFNGRILRPLGGERILIVSPSFSK